MKNNKIIIYVGVLAVGILLGWLFFGGSSKQETKQNQNQVGEQGQMWTCSMHPQIMQPEPGDCPICGMDLIPAESGADGLTLNEFKMTENAMALANIQTTIVGDVTMADGNKLSLSGKIVANEEENAVQASYFEGRIEKLNVNFTGEEVRKGQLLATIYAPTLVAAQQELLTASSMKSSQPALYNAVRNKLKLWKLSESQINQIESSGKVRENFPIYATVSGIVSRKMVEEGDYVKQGQPIVKLIDLRMVWAVFDAYENQISQLKEGQPIKVTTNAYPNKEFDAKISFIDPVLNTKSRTIDVRSTLNNKEGLLKPGMFVTGKLDVSNASNSQSIITVPATAVLWTGARSLVYVKTNRDEPVFEMREVTLGPKNGEVYAILEGLSNGEEVVTNGTFTVDAAAQLKGKKSMMNTKAVETMASHEALNGKETTDDVATFRKNVSPKFKEQLNLVFENYNALKEALVNDQGNKAMMAAGALKKSLANVNHNLLKGEDEQNHWIQLNKELKSSTDEIAQTANILKQREYFISLSGHFINALKTFGINKKVYVDYCPMANNNNGAYWLSKQKEILNPYFGSAMLTCGEVKEVIE